MQGNTCSLQNGIPAGKFRRRGAGSRREWIFERIQNIAKL
jgi:hypothetical protein